MIESHLCKCGKEFYRNSRLVTKCYNCAKKPLKSRGKKTRPNKPKKVNSKSKQSLNVDAIQKYSDKTTPQLIKIAERHFNTFIKLRDTDDYGRGNCISSGQPLKYPSKDKKAQAGHYYSGGHYPWLKFHEYNVHLQGKSDNYFKSGNLIEYRKNLIKKIGIENVEELDRLAAQGKRNGFKWDRFFLIEVIEKYKKINKELKKEKVY